jgi:hypothetical protein
MRLLIVLLAGVAGLAAQGTEQDARAKLQQEVRAKAEQFARNLQNAMRPSGGTVSLNLMRPPNRVCAIPLLKVGPDASFKSNMPMIAPDPKITFSARELIPPGPVCGEQARK